MIFLGLEACKIFRVKAAKPTVMPKEKNATMPNFTISRRVLLVLRASKAKSLVKTNPTKKETIYPKETER